MAWRLLLHDRSSTAGSRLGVVAIIFLVGQQLSILFGLLNYMSVLVDHSGADLWITSARLHNADAGKLISGRYLERVLGLPEVRWAEPILRENGLLRTVDGSHEAVRLVGLRRPRLAAGPWAFAAGDGRALIDLEAVAVDRLDLAKFGHPHLQGVTEINGRRVRFGAVTQGARAFQGTLVFLSLDRVKEAAKTPPGRYSAILVGLKPGVDRDHALARLRALMPAWGFTLLPSSPASPDSTISPIPASAGASAFPPPSPCSSGWRSSLSPCMPVFWGAPGILR